MIQSRQTIHFRARCTDACGVLGPEKPTKALAIEAAAAEGWTFDTRRIIGQDGRPHTHVTAWCPACSRGDRR